MTYYRARKLAPYLQHQHPTQIDSTAAEAHVPSSSVPAGMTPSRRRSIGTRNTSSAGLPSEADAAAGAGGFQQRVSSLSNLLMSSTTGNTTPRVAHTSTGIQHKSETAAGITRGARRAIRGDEDPQPRQAETTTTTKIVPDWRTRERMKTVGVGLIVALNVGTDPPDIVKPYPCAVLQCWTDPRKYSRAKAKEIIGEKLEAQYSKWQISSKAKSNALKYRRALDPTVEDVRNLCLRLRSSAKSERVLLHYNGHGVPRPTDHGEIWVFDKNHTEYVPLAISDLQQWLGSPSIIIFDCSAAGILLPFLVNTNAYRHASSSSANNSPSTASLSSIDDPAALAAAAMHKNDTIVLCPCAENQWLPMHPDYPADIFTSCLTTPIPMALRWFVRNNVSMKNLHPDAVDAIPGVISDRKTPLGELNWIFTAVTDSIAWNMLPKELFQRLFRQDLLVASMFRNFLLANRIMRSLNCTPISHPPLPHSIADHPLWQSWDLAVETCLFGLISQGVLGNHVVSVKTTSRSDMDEDSSTLESPESEPSPPPPLPPPPTSTPMTDVSSPFFSEQLDAFEVWLQFSELHKRKLATYGPSALSTPEQLPVVLQVFLGPTHRTRALMLLRKFLLELGPWAVNASLSLGIFFYVMKLLQSPENKSLLISISAAIFAFDSSCRADALKNRLFQHFVQHIMYGFNHTTAQLQTNDHEKVSEAAQQRTLAAFILAVACHGYPPGQAECIQWNLHGSCGALLSSYEQGNEQDENAERHLPAHFRLWLCLCLGNVVLDSTYALQMEVDSSGVHQRLAVRLRNDSSPDVRAAVCYALGALIGGGETSKSNYSKQTNTSNISGNIGRATSSQETHLAPSQQILLQPGVGLQLSSSNVLPGTGVNPSATAGHLRTPFTTFGGGIIPTLQLNHPITSGGPAFPMPSQTTGTTHLPVQMTAAPGVAGQLWNPSATTSLRGLSSGPYMLHTAGGGQPMTSLGAPSSFLMGGGPMVTSSPSASTPTPTFLNPLPQQFLPNPAHIADVRPVHPTVFEDRHRLELDLSSIGVILDEAVVDGSVVVRYEATIALGVAVTKYIDAFVFVAEEYVVDGHTADEADYGKSIRIPHGMENDDAERFKAVWKALRSLQREDPFPAISKAANDIVSAVHEKLLSQKMGMEELASGRDRKSRTRLGGIAEESRSPSPSSPPVPTIQQRTNERKSERKTVKDKSDIRRVASEVVSGKGASGIRSMEDNALLIPPAKAFANGSDYKFPVSKFFEWKKNSFDPNFEWLNDEDDLDPLSPEGAARAYSARRSSMAREMGRKLAARYSTLAPKPPKTSKQKIELILEEEEDTAVAEEDSTAKKQELELKEKKLLVNEGVRTTSMVVFHPYEDYLMACGDGIVSLWCTENGRRLIKFRNGSPKSARMTSSFWINEDSSSLFMVGCDDGTVRVWGNLLQANGELGTGLASLVSAFRAAPLVSGPEGSGLVCEWQSFSGMLMAGGASKYLRCWDLEAEKIVSKLETKSDAYVTTLTTAWDSYNIEEVQSHHSLQGIGKDTIVAGFSDGTLKIFDIRVNRVAKDLDSRPSRRVTSYSEHKSWVVATAFTSYSNRHELISGTLSGEIKAWDLRMSASIRTVEVQRSTMTTLALHSKIPIIATGSSAQFIKLATPDGDALQVLRYHEKMASHRLGPVSCLAFHPYKPLLASGSIDSYIGLYQTKQYAQQNIN